MTPNTKRLLATLVVAIVGAILPILTTTGQEALPALAAVISSVSLAVAYYVRAWGTKEGVIDELLSQPGRVPALDEDVDFEGDDDEDQDEEEDEEEDEDEDTEPRT